MSVPYTVSFLNGSSLLGSTAGTIAGVDIPIELQDIVAYFSANTLGVKSLRVQTWNTLSIICNGNTYTFTR